MNKIVQHNHTPEAIAKRLAKPPKQHYLRDWIYGGIDGTVTTFAVVSGVIGGQLSHIVILILGFANLFADGFSMAAGNYLGTKSEKEQYQQHEKTEEQHIDVDPEGEKQEIRQILVNKGFQKENLEKMVNLISSNRKLWISIMLHEEYGLPGSIRSPWLAALSTFFSFIICGFFPLMPYVFSFDHGYFFSIILTGVVFFIIGSMKSKWSLQKWWYSGLVTLLIGSIVAMLAYFVGYVLHLYLVYLKNQ